MSTVLQESSALARAKDHKLDQEGDDKVVENFLATLRFFPTPRPIAARILQLNQALGDSLIEDELNALSSTQALPTEDETFEKTPSWVDMVLARISSVLFHEDYSPPEQNTLSGEELVSFFQKVISERIYDHLSFLSLSPHARKGESFSITEELTEGIAEDVGLSLFRHSQTPDDLCLQTRDALFDLASEFQRWLLEERGGSYTAGWGEIRTTGSLADDETDASQLVVWLEPDVESGVSNRGYVGGSVAAAR